MLDPPVVGPLVVVAVAVAVGSPESEVPDVADVSDVPDVPEVPDAESELSSVASESQLPSLPSQVDEIPAEALVGKVAAVALSRSGSSAQAPTERLTLRPTS